MSNELKTIKAIAFDIDGTLYPNMRLYLRLIPYFLKNIKFFITYSKVRHILHRTAPLPDFFEYQARLLGGMLDIPSSDARALIDEKIYSGLSPFFTKVKPYSHVLETFVVFKEHGYKLGLLSDFPPSQKGDVWGVAPICDAVLGTEECGALKPSIYPFGLLSRALDVPMESILYIGNSIRSDIKGAKSAGMKTAYIMPFWRRLFNIPLKEADISFRNYRQLQKIVLQ